MDFSGGYKKLQQLTRHSLNDLRNSRLGYIAQMQQGPPRICTLRTRASDEYATEHHRTRPGLGALDCNPYGAQQQRQHCAPSPSPRGLGRIHIHPPAPANNFRVP